jgi:hypothetical protein
MRIGELSRRSGISVRMLRYYEREGPRLLPCDRLRAILRQQILRVDGRIEALARSRSLLRDILSEA